MAAHDDSNKPKCKANVNNDRERDFVTVYKSLEQVLNSRSEQFERKVESLIEAWKQVYHYSSAVKDLYFVQLMDWAKFHTLNLVLNGDWKNYKDVYEEKLLCEVKKTEDALLKLNNLFSLRCKKLAEVIRDPWGNPILNRLLNNPEAHIGPKEIEFFCLETGYLVSHRLKKLCEQHCEDLALNFVSAFIRCLSLAESQQFNLNTTEQQKWFIMDIYVALLFKYRRIPQILKTLKEMNLSEGCELVKRFANKRVKISKVWRHSNKIAQLASQVFVTSAVMAPIEEGGEKLGQLLDIWFTYNENESSLDSLAESIRRIVHAAESAEQMYIICDVLHRKFDSRAKIILVELLIRSLTTDMNRLENLKHEENLEEELKTKIRMSSAFDKLSRILEEKTEVARECALTGFSLTPTEERLRLIEDFAKKSGCNVDETAKEWTCRLHPPALPSDEVTWQCDTCGGYMSHPKLEAALNTTNTLLCEALRPDKLGLNPLLCDDLAVLLSSPKYHLLSWLLSWPDLHRMCVVYLRNPQSIKKIVSVLEYAEPDYSLYSRRIKSEPLDEEEIPTGIEKGYEHFLFPLPEETGSETESAPTTPVSQVEQECGGHQEMFQQLFPNFASFVEETAKYSSTTKLRQFRKNLKRPPKTPSAQQFQIPAKLIRQQHQPFDFEQNTSRAPIHLRRPITMEQPYPAHCHPPRPPGRQELRVDYFDFAGRYHPHAIGSHGSPVSSYMPMDLSLPSGQPGVASNELVNVPSRPRVVEEAARREVRDRDEDSIQVVNEEQAEAGQEGVERVEKGAGQPEVCEREGGAAADEAKAGGDQPNQVAGVAAGPMEVEKKDVVTAKMIDDAIQKVSANYDVKVLKALVRHLLGQRKMLLSKQRALEGQIPALQQQSEEPTTPQQPRGEFPAPRQPRQRKPVKPGLQTVVDTIVISDAEDDRSVSEAQSKRRRLNSTPAVVVEQVSDIEKEGAVTYDAMPAYISTPPQPVSSPEYIIVEADVHAPCEGPATGYEITRESPVPLPNSGGVYYEIIQGYFPAPSCDEASEVSTGCEETAKSSSVDPTETNTISSQTTPERPRVIPLPPTPSSTASSKKSSPFLLARSSSSSSSESSYKPLTVPFDEFENFSLAMRDSPELTASKPPPKIKLKEATVILNRINIKQYLNKKLKRRAEADNEATENNNGKGARYKPAGKMHQGSFPLQDKNPRVETKRERAVEWKKYVKKSDKKSERKKKRPEKISHKSKDIIKWQIQRNNAFSPKTLDQLLKSPKVILEKLDDAFVRKSVLANVPGLNDLELIQPERNEPVVQVVQVPGGRPTSTVTSQNSQTSTQITPHIQRVGQPRNDKPTSGPVSDNPEASVATSQADAAAVKPARSQPSTLINILSHQVIAPPQNRQNRINILSHHLIKPATVTETGAKTTTTTIITQANNTTRIVTAGGDQIINQLANPSRSTTLPKPPVVSPQGADQNRILQFICKSTDGKLIPVTSFPTNRASKTTTTTTTTQAGVAPISPTFEEAYAKFPKQKSNDELDGAETLPKFQQAFGKSAYQNSIDTTTTTITTTNSTSADTVVINNIDGDKKVPRTTSVVQPIQGGVIYTRQMPVGQAINLIPPGRGQVFRIATSNPDPTVIHSKMSALLAAALQGKPKNSEAVNSDGAAAEEDGDRSRSALSAQLAKPVLNAPATRSQQTNLSSTTLEQLREFDMVYRQVKERSSTNTGGETAPTETEGQRLNVAYVSQGQKFTQISPVVVVSSGGAYCNLQPAASPALSVTSQGSSSPCITPAATPTLPKVASKNSKGKTVKSATTHASKASPIPKPQQKPQEDEHTTQRIFDILAEYAEQLRNSPDLNNKPAPRRRSNPPTNPSQNSKRKKNSGSNGAKKSGQCSSTISSDADVEDPRTIGSEDSSCGVVQISMQEDEPTVANQTGETSNETPSSGSCQPLILTDSPHNQTRNLIIADSSVGEALKMPSTAVLVPGNYIMPVSMVKGGQQIAVVSGGSKILATVPARSGPNMLLFQSFLNQSRKSGMPTVKYSAIQPISGISSQSIAGVSAQPPVILPPTGHGLSAVALGQPISIKKINEQNNTELLLAISQPQFAHHPADTNIQPTNNNQNISAVESDRKDSQPVANNTEKMCPFQKSLITAPIATSVISQTVSAKEEHSDMHGVAIPTQDVSKGESAKVERVQSVLVTASSSANGPMLSHSPPAAAVTKQPYKAEFFHIVEMPTTDCKQQQFQTNTTYYTKPKKQIPPTVQKQEREVHQLTLRKQAAIERELRLQKSLSEECEDLGVDEPSTSDLFPEADLLFDHQSPPFEQITPKRTVLLPEAGKDETKLFGGDDSSSVGASLLFDSVEYPSSEFEYGQPTQVSNGQSTSNDTGSSCEDAAMLHHCTSMSGMTLNSPAGDEPYLERQPSANKYKYKYSNRKKLERSKQQENWPQEASSSEDTTGSTDMKRSSQSPDVCSNKHSCGEEQPNDGEYKKEELKEDEECREEEGDGDVESSVCGRGARRPVKKSECSCCNGADEFPASRKRTAAQIHMQAPHKKAFLGKKR